MQANVPRFRKIFWTIVFVSMFTLAIFMFRMNGYEFPSVIEQRYAAFRLNRTLSVPFTFNVPLARRANKTTNSTETEDSEIVFNRRFDEIHGGFDNSPSFEQISDDDVSDVSVDEYYQKAQEKEDDAGMNEIYPDDLPGVIINSRYYIEESIDEGLTGMCRRGVDLVTREKVAIKLAKEGRDYSLEDEFQNYMQLGAHDPEVIQYGIPHIKYYGIVANYTAMVMTLFGPSLFELMHREKYNVLPIKTTLLFGIQALDRFKYVHSRGLVVQDVKPLNFVIGNTIETVNTVYLIDFGFSRGYLDKNGNSVPREYTEHHHGTPEYMGLGPLMNYTNVRKDDLISLGLTMLDVHGVRMPWMELPTPENIWTSMAAVLEAWRTADMEAICWASDAPSTFIRYFQYLDTLNSKDAPDYEYLKDVLGRTLSQKEVDDMDLDFQGWENERILK